MKTDQREAYQSSKFGLFSCFCTTSWKIAKIITYMVKSDFLLVKRNDNFMDNKVWRKKILPPPLPPKMAMFAEKSQKLRFFNFKKKKKQLGENHYSKINCF